MPVPKPQWPFLSHPYLLAPAEGEVVVAWCTSVPGDGARVVVGDRSFDARTHQLTRMADDAHGQITPRQVWRHVVRIPGLAPGATHRYRVEVIVDDTGRSGPAHVLRATPADGAPARLLLTSDHQLHPNAAHCMELAHATFGEVDAVVFSGGLANCPDRAAEWFDDDRAFFRSMQGCAHAEGSKGRRSPGAPLLQSVPLLPCIGNHEVQGALAGRSRLSMSAIPRSVAERHCPGDVPQEQREGWIEDHSWSLGSYEQLFAPPDATTPRWYATTIGNVRLITLFHTRQWRGPEADPDPARRTRSSRFQEAADVVDDLLRQGHGCHLFSDIAPGSAQYQWLERELRSPARLACAYTIVQVHEGALGWGGNVEPPMCTPERIEETDGGRLVGIRYEYSHSRNVFFRHVMPLLERAGVQLVVSGHSHCWGRFARGGTQYLEASNTGRSHGVHTDGSPRPVPPPPWRTDEYCATDDPHGTPPAATPWGDSDVVAFTLFDGASGALECWRSRVDGEPELFDRVCLKPTGA